MADCLSAVALGGCFAWIWSKFARAARGDNLDDAREVRFVEPPRPFPPLPPVVRRPVSEIRPFAPLQPSFRDECADLPSSGRLRVYHGTSVLAAQSIQATNVFRPSSRGLYGSTIYFSKNLQKAQEFGPMILECEVDEWAVEQIEERGGIVCCDDFRKAHGTIKRAFRQRQVCSEYNRCSHIECRECRTAEERRLEHAILRQQREDWEHSKKRCPGLRGAPCKGSGWCRQQSKFCKSCHQALYGA